MAVLLAAAGSSLFPALLLRGVRVRATVEVPGKIFSGDSCSFSSICKAENGERPKKSLKPHNGDDNPQFPHSQSHLTPPFTFFSRRKMFPQHCWHP